MQTPGNNLDALIAKLQTVPILQRLDRASLTQLAQSAVQRTYTAGTAIFLEGDPAPALYYVDSGWVKVVKMGFDGREQVLYFWGPGEIFGGVGAFVNRPAPATAIALEATVLWILPRDAIRQLIATNPAVALSVIEFMADRLGELIELVADLSLHTVTARLARLLLEQAEGNVVQRQRWATQTEMAARLGTVPDVLNRALRGLVEEGLIELSRHQIRILNHQGLATKTTPTP